MTLRSTSVLNDLPLSRTPLQTVSLNVRQNQSSMHRRRARNPHEVVIDFSSSNTRSISAKSSFGSIGFTTSSENDQENSVPGVIYKSSD